MVSRRSQSRARTARQRRNRPFAVPRRNRDVRRSRNIVDVYGIVELRTKYVPTAGSRQLVEQPLCFFQVLGVEALGEPAVDGREQVAGVCAAALVAMKPGQVRGSAQFE